MKTRIVFSGGERLEVQQVAEVVREKLEAGELMPLARPDGSEVWVNPRQIAYLEPLGNMKRTVWETIA
jgi:hypothetical protein